MMRTSVLRAFVVGACTIGVLLNTAAVASADPPSREPLPVPDITLPESVCGFPVEATVLTNREMLTTFSNGNVMITGALKVQLTNATDPTKSIVINESGPGTITQNADGTFTLTGRGRSVLFFFPGDLGPGSTGALLLTTGRFTEHFTSSFQLIPGSLELSNPAEDLCAQLA